MNKYTYTILHCQYICTQVLLKYDHILHVVFAKDLLLLLTKYYNKNMTRVRYIHIAAHILAVLTEKSIITHMQKHLSSYNNKHDD